MNSPWTVVGATVDSAQVRELLGGVGRTRLYTLRQQGVIPDPDGPLSAPKRPEWRTETIVKALPPERRSYVVYEGFDTPELEGQRWEFKHNSGELLELHVHEDEEPALAWRWVYEYRGSWHDISAWNPSGEASVLVPLNGAGWHDLAPHRSVAPAVYKACGYGDGTAGTLLILDPTSERHLMGALVPSAATDRVAVESIWARTASRLLGHPLPWWPKGCTTLELVSAWNPETRRPVPMAEPPSAPRSATIARRARAQAKALKKAGADQQLIDSFEDMDTMVTNTMLSSVEYYGPKEEGERVLAVQMPEPKYGGLRPGGFLPALEWLVSAEDAPEEFARLATSFFGYQDSMGVASVPAPEPLTDDSAVRLGFSPSEEGSSFIWRALREKAGDVPAEAYRWNVETEFPTAVLATADRWFFHAPRKSVIDPDELDSVVLSIDPTYGLGRTFDGEYVPLALHPDGGPGAVAECFAAWAQNPHYEAPMGHHSPVVRAPQGLTAMMHGLKGRSSSPSLPNLMALARDLSDAE